MTPKPITKNKLIESLAKELEETQKACATLKLDKLSLMEAARNNDTVIALKADTIDKQRHDINALKGDIATLREQVARAEGYIDRVNENEPAIVRTHTVPQYEAPRGPRINDVLYYSSGGDLSAVPAEARAAQGNAPQSMRNRRHWFTR